MKRVRPFKTTLITACVAMALATAGCSPSDDPAEPVPSDGATTSDDAPESSEPADEDAAPAASGDEYTAEDIGTGTLTVNGVLEEGFVGGCEVSRDLGREDVGDISSNTAELEFVVGVDNFEAAGAAARNFNVAFDDLFNTTTEAVGLRVNGTITSYAWGSELTPYGDSQEIGVVVFTGTTDDGDSVVAELVCEIQNTF